MARLLAPRLLGAKLGAQHPDHSLGGAAPDRLQVQRSSSSVAGPERPVAGGPRFGRVLDAPCGTGRLTDALAPLTEQLVSLDVSRAMLTAAPAAFGGAARVEASVFALPFAPASFDVVVACRLLHHFPAALDRRAVLGELARVARRFVVVSYWDAASWQAWRRRTRGPFRRRGHDTRVAIAARELDLDLADAGLTRIARAHSLRFVSPQTFVLAARAAK